MLTEFLLSLFIPFVGSTQGAEAKMANQSEQGQKFEGVYKGGQRTPLSTVEEALKNLKIKEESAKFHMQMCYDALQEAELKKSVPVSLDEINEMLEDLYKELDKTRSLFTDVEVWSAGEDNFLFAFNEKLKQLKQAENSKEENMRKLAYIKSLLENEEELEVAANTSAEYAKTVCEEAKLASDRVEEAKRAVRQATNNFMNFIARNN